MNNSGTRFLAFSQKPLQQAPRIQRGLTMVELLVAMVISTLIALAAIASLLISRQGFTAVDASSQLRDNARFATDLIQRLGVQTGFQDVLYAATMRKPVMGIATDPDPNVSGFNNSSASVSGTLVTATARTAGSLGYGSDILILRYQANETFPGSGKADNAMIDCMGTTTTGAVPINRDDRMLSVLYVAKGSDGEPSLMCGNGGTTSQPLIQGVENFQVLYGVDGVTANTTLTSTPDFIADHYLRADQMVVGAIDSNATKANWERVRSIRIGMVLRGAPGSSQDRAAQTFYPFGSAQDSSTGTTGSAMSSANDPGTIFSPTPDGRLRQVVTFTVHLRNEQGN